MADVFVVVNPKTEPDVKVIITSGGSSGGEGGDIVMKNDTFEVVNNENVFTLSYVEDDTIYVDINGLIQLEDDYTVIGSTLTLSFTPENGDIINIKYTI